MSNMLEEFIRPVTDKDKDLPEFSHSRLECFQNCPYQFDLKYNQNKVTTDTTIALELGSICHKVLELKGKMIKDNKPVDYDLLLNILDEGDKEDDLLGIKDLKSKYWEDWNVKDSENRDYNEKIDIFKIVLKTEMEDSDWTPYLFEHEFNLVYKDRIRIHGFIDRIDKRGDEYRLIDYKTSKKVYDEAKNKTSQQFAIYNMALLIEFNQLAADNIYRFICIDAEQHALSLGWEKRFCTKLDKVLDSIDEGYKTKIWTPKATPLCYWCTYGSNPTAKMYKEECQYYSLWTPTNKSFEKHKEFNPNEKEEPKRKLVF